MYSVCVARLVSNVCPPKALMRVTVHYASRSRVVANMESSELGFTCHLSVVKCRIFGVRRRGIHCAACQGAVAAHTQCKARSSSANPASRPAQAVEAVADAVRRHGVAALVVDPVLVATRQIHLIKSSISS